MESETGPTDSHDQSLSISLLSCITAVNDKPPFKLILGNGEHHTKQLCDEMAKLLRNTSRWVTD